MLLEFVVGVAVLVGLVTHVAIVPRVRRRYRASKGFFIGLALDVAGSIRSVAVLVTLVFGSIGVAAFWARGEEQARAGQVVATLQRIRAHEHSLSVLAREYSFGLVCASLALYFLLLFRRRWRVENAEAERRSRVEAIEDELQGLVNQHDALRRRMPPDDLKSGDTNFDQDVREHAATLKKQQAELEARMATLLDERFRLTSPAPEPAPARGRLERVLDFLVSEGVYTLARRSKLGFSAALMGTMLLGLVASTPPAAQHSMHELAASLDALRVESNATLLQQRAQALPPEDVELDAETEAGLTRMAEDLSDQLSRAFAEDDEKRPVPFGQARAVILARATRVPVEPETPAAARTTDTPPAPAPGSPGERPASVASTTNEALAGAVSGESVVVQKVRAALATRAKKDKGFAAFVRSFSQRAQRKTVLTAVAGDLLGDWLGESLEERVPRVLPRGPAKQSVKQAVKRALQYVVNSLTVEHNKPSTTIERVTAAIDEAVTKSELEDVRAEIHGAVANRHTGEPFPSALPTTEKPLARGVVMPSDEPEAFSTYEDLYPSSPEVETEVTAANDVSPELRAFRARVARSFVAAASSPATGGVVIGLTPRKVEGDFIDLLPKRQGGRIRFTLISSTGAVTETREFPESIVAATLAYVADQRLVPVTITTVLTFDQKVHLHPAFVDTPLGCHLVRADRLTFEVLDQKSSVAGARFRAEQAKAYADVDRYNDAVSGELDFGPPIATDSIVRWRPAFEPSVVAALDACHSPGPCKAVLNPRAQPVLAGTRSGVREQDYELVPPFEVLSARPYRFLVQETFSVTPQRAVRAWDYPMLGDSVDAEVEQYVRTHPDDARTMQAVSDFIQLQRVFRAALDGHLGPAFPLARVVQLSQPVRRNFRTPRWIRGENAPASELRTALGIAAEPEPPRCPDL